MADISKIQVPIDGVMTELNIKGSGGSANYYGTCTGQESNQTKAVTISSDQGFELKTGVLIFVKFDANNTYNATSSNPIKLNVNSTGAKQIYAANTATPTGTNTTYFGRTNYINQYIYNGTYWVWNGSSADNTVNNQVRYGDAVKAAAAVTDSTICVGASSGYKTAASGITFDISYPILYTSSAVDSGSTGTNFYRVVNNRSAASLKSGFSGVAYSTCYLVLSSISGNIATIDSTVYTVTPNVEGKMYIPIGIFFSTTKLDIDLTNQTIFVYDGSNLKPYSPNSGGGGTGGHTIQNSSGTDMTARSKLQFKGANVTDDSTNNRTIVDIESVNGSYWTDNVSCSSGSTSATIIDSKITTDSVIDVYCKTNSGNPLQIRSINITSGQAVINFVKITENANIKLNVIDYSLDNQAIWSNEVSAAIGDTSVTIQNSNITTSSIIKVYSETASGLPVRYNNETITTGQIVISFDALEEATDFRARIFNL